jgi:Flp pilus assembly protein TadG
LNVGEVMKKQAQKMVYTGSGFARGALRYLRATGGTTAMMFAVSLPAVMGAVGLASDFAIYSMKLAKLQAAADHGAIAGAKEFALSTSTSKSINDAAASFVKASYDAGAALSIKVKADTGKETVKVDLEEAWTPFFAHFVGAQVTPVVAHATAALAGQSNICILALNPVLPLMLLVDSNGKIMAKSCGVYSDSKSTAAITVKSSGVISATVTCSAGGVSNSGSITPSATTDCPVIPDPLASRPPPPVGACMFNKYKITTGTAVLNPGTYCGGLEVSGTAKVSFSEGTYVIKDGEFKISNTAVATGDHVGFFLTGLTSKINFTGASTVSFTGAVTGEMSGLLFYEDRASAFYRVHRINSANANTLTGTIYLPKGYLLIDPGSQIAQDSAYTAIIVQGLMVQSGPELVLNSNYSQTDVPVPAGIRSEARVVLQQ